MQRSCKTEGEVVGFTTQAFGAQTRVAFVVVELGDEALEGAPELDEVRAALSVGEIGREAGDLCAHACDLAGSQIDQQVQLSVRVEEGGGECAPVGGIMRDVVEG